MIIIMMRMRMRVQQGLEIAFNSRSLMQLYYGGNKPHTMVKAGR